MLFSASKDTELKELQKKNIKRKCTAAKKCEWKKKKNDRNDSDGVVVIIIIVVIRSEPRARASRANDDFSSG